MSGTQNGTCALPVSPESAVSGPLALVQTGDWIALDLSRGRLDLLLDESELDELWSNWRPPDAPRRGWSALYVAHVSQAEDGCDFDFLLADGQPVKDPEIF